MDKKLAIQDTLNQLAKSATWKELNEPQRRAFLSIIDNFYSYFKGTYEQRQLEVHIAYIAFLKGINWRG